MILHIPVSVCILLTLKIMRRPADRPPPAGEHTQTQGLGFFGQKPLITICLLLCRPTAQLLSNTHTVSALLVNSRVLIKN